MQSQLKTRRGSTWWWSVPAAAGLLGLVYAIATWGKVPQVASAAHAASASAPAAQNDPSSYGKHEKAVEANSDHPREEPVGLPACRDVRVLYVEVGPDGVARGAWFADGALGAKLVLPGEQVGEATLTRVSAGRHQQPGRVWMRTADGPCSSPVTVDDDSRSTTASGSSPPQPIVPSPDQPETDAPARHVELADIPKARRIAEMFTNKNKSEGEDEDAGAEPE